MRKLALIYLITFLVIIPSRLDAKSKKLKNLPRESLFSNHFQSAPSVDYSSFCNDVNPKSYIAGQIVYKVKDISSEFENLNLLSIRTKVKQAYSSKLIKSLNQYKNGQDYHFENVHLIDLNKDHAEGTNLCFEMQTLLVKLNQDPNIEYAEPNYIRQTQVMINDIHYNNGNLWALDKIQAESAWDLSTGDGVIVAVIDSGVDFNHPDLWDNIWVNPRLVPDRNGDGRVTLDDADTNNNKILENNSSVNEFFQSIDGSDKMIGFDFVDFDGNPKDSDGHGTHVAGTIAANGNNGIGITGVAFDATILPIRLIDFGISNILGLTTLSSLAAIEVAVNKGAQIINASYGGKFFSQAEANAYQFAFDNNVLVVAAAGNDNEDVLNMFPANLKTTLSVAALDRNDRRASFSNFGNTVDLAAPGTEIVSTMGNDDEGAISFVSSENREFGYWSLQGTSMAAPHVSGLAALIFSYEPSFTINDVASIFTSGVDPVTTDKPVGRGRINAQKTMNAAQDLKSLYALDKNKDTFVTLNELVSMILDIRKANQRVFLYDSILDIDNNGTIGNEDYTLILEKIIEPNELDEFFNIDQVIASINIVDTDFDGFVTRSERKNYKRGFKKARKGKDPNLSFDINNDGNVNKADQRFVKSVFRSVKIRV